MVTFSSRVTVTDSGSANTGMSAVVIYNGIEVLYTQQQATDIGNYYDPDGAFVQGCLVSYNVLLPSLVVMFRPDLDSNRREIIFELGDMYSTTPFNMTTYGVEIYDNHVLLTTIQVPLHYNFTRWRWQSAPRPIRKTRQELIASGLVPHYDSTILGRYLTNLKPQTYEIMGLAGIYPAMHATGERPDIGVVTDWQANFLCNGAIVSTVIAQGEATNTYPIIIRDNNTLNCAPLDVIANPGANMYSSSAGQPFIKNIAGLVAYDTGHSPASAYLPALLTGDPYYIEALQFQANKDHLDKPPSYRYADGGRYGAWPQRNTVYADVATPEVTPGWMLPKGHFAQHLEKIRGKIIVDMGKTTDPIYSEFRLRNYGGSQGTTQHPAGYISALWQDEYETSIYAMCVQLGYPQWMDQLKWKAYQTIKRVENGEWIRASPSPYNTSFNYTCNLAAACGATDTKIVTDKYGRMPWPSLPFEVKIKNEKLLVTNIANHPEWTVQRGYGGTVAAAQVINTPIVGPKMKTWEEATARNKSQYPEEFPVMPNDPSGMNEIYHETGSSVSRTSFCRGALALAVRHLTEAELAYSWIDNQFNQYVSASWSPAWKWCITNPIGTMVILSADETTELTRLLAAVSPGQEPSKLRAVLRKLRNASTR